MQDQIIDVGNDHDHHTGDAASQQRFQDEDKLTIPGDNHISLVEVVKQKTKEINNQKNAVEQEMTYAEKGFPAGNFPKFRDSCLQGKEKRTCDDKDITAQKNIFK